MFDFFRIGSKLNAHDKKVAKAKSKVVEAVNDLTKVNNGLVTMDADVTAKANKYTDISSSVKEKIESNKNVIETLKTIHSK